MSEEKNTSKEKNDNAITTLKIQDKKEVINAVNENGVGSFVLSLLDISNKVFVNTRGSIVGGKNRVKTSPQHISNIARTLGLNRYNQQLQSLNCAIHINKENKMPIIGIYEGFTRFEAMNRNALAGLIDEWNIENQLKPGDADYIIPVNLDDNDYVPDIDYEHENQRVKIYEAGGEWKEKYIKCLRSYPVKVEVVKNISDKSAFTKGVVGNYAREKPPVWSMATNILTMLNVYKIKGIEVAKNLGVTSALISQYKAVAEIPENMNSILEEDEESNTDENRKALEICIDEFIRRASLPIDDKCAVQISHSKALATLIRNHKSHNLTFNRALKLMRLLCCINADGSLNSSAQTLNLSVFEQHIESTKRAGQKVTEFDLTDGIEELLNTSIGVDDAASEQASNNESKDEGKDEGKDENDSIMNSLIEEISQAKESDEIVTCSEVDDEEDEDDDLLNSLIEDSETTENDETDDSDDSEDDDSDNDDNDDDDDDISSLVGSLLGEEETKVEVDDTGKKKSSTVENIESKVFVKSVDKLMSKIMTAKLMIATFIEEQEENDVSSVNWLEIIINLSSILTLSDVLNDKEMNNKYQSVVIRLSECYSEFIAPMIEFCKEKMPAGQWNKITKGLSEFDKAEISE